MSDADSADPHDLARFLDAQAGVIERALAELRAGAKRSHWMWFVFPQLDGLGTSPMAQRYAIASLDEARAYLAHPVLGARLRAGVQAALASGEASPQRLFGRPDDMKFRSCLTLFRAASSGEDQAMFQAALDRFYAGEPDPLTLARSDVGSP